MMDELLVVVEESSPSDPEKSKTTYSSLLLKST